MKKPLLSDVRTAAFLILTCLLYAAPARLQADCNSQILFGPTEADIVLQVDSSFQLPLAPNFDQLCIFQSGEPFFWEVDIVALESPFFGDGSPGLNISFFSGATEQNLSLFIPNSYITSQGAFPITSDPVFPVDSVAGVSWSFSHSPDYFMAFDGSLTYDADSNLATLSITFSAGNPPVPSNQIADLIAFVGGAEAIDAGLENALIASLDAAQASVDAGNTQTAQAQLNALINKVQAVKGKRILDAVADQIIAAAQSILDSID
jgi:hypothetical protein